MHALWKAHCSIHSTPNVIITLLVKLSYPPEYMHN